MAELPHEIGYGQSLVGHIAYLAPEHADEWHKLDVSSLSEQAATEGALPLVVAVPHPSQSIYARNAAKPYIDKPLPVPTLIVAASSAPKLSEAMAQRQAVAFELNGLVDENAFGVNVLAKLDRGGDWVVVSTPSSGWFTAAGERGGGVALWLGAARWVAQHDKTNSYVFVSNSGHELDMLGSKYTLNRMPAPDDVSLWFHLGASIGTRQWEKTDMGFNPLDESNGIYLFAHWRQYWTAITKFSRVPELKILPSFILPSDRGELVHFIDAGYPAMGFVGDHLYFHTPDDKPGVSSPELLAPYAEGLVNLFESFQP